MSRNIGNTIGPLRGLGPVASTLLIPLAARAHGDALFPRQALGDASARRVLRALRTDVSVYLRDRVSVYGVLARSHVFRGLAQRFFERSPCATGVSLGAGLGHYFQWLDRGTNRWIDADLPEVTALRERLLPGIDEGRMNLACDLTQPGWWQRLGLPSRQTAGPHEPPVLLVCEGVLMYLEPAQVQAVLREFGHHAPPGSRLLLDTLCWLAVGRAQKHPSVRHTNAQFRWGLRHWAELTAPHPRLRLNGMHQVMEGYGWPYNLMGPAFRLAFGVPFYAIANIGVDA
ncbi:MAG: hypothetical protein AD742_08320 [Methylibium sp. NZG]|nr:MAG: hypothetical protein AD742_08320 [Methylibium sp. NZG]